MRCVPRPRWTRASRCRSPEILNIAARRNGEQMAFPCPRSWSSGCGKLRPTRAHPSCCPRQAGKHGGSRFPDRAIRATHQREVKMKKSTLLAATVALGAGIGMAGPAVVEEVRLMTGPRGGAGYPLGGPIQNMGAEDR